MLYPLTFQPIFKERVWGGRRLADLFGKPLPPDARIGESWEITDRPEGVSVIANGPLAGHDLRWLMEQHGGDVLGREPRPLERFPWLVKLLDAADDLSLQVHPPADRAAALGGEPKTEMWFFADTAPGAQAFAGLRPGVTREDFAARARAGTVAECFHRLPTRRGDVLFLPSGRVHALGRGNVVFEIQQNSDTTYRVFDWNRPGLDGRPRELHLEASIASIDFSDFAPSLVSAGFSGEESRRHRLLVDDSLFRIEHWKLQSAALGDDAPHRGPEVIGVIAGALTVSGTGQTVGLSAGGFCLVPAVVPARELRAVDGAEFLRVTLPHHPGAV